MRLATIGFGGMGQGDTRTATSLPGTQLIAVCDLYDGRLAHAKEVYGPNTVTTREYREVLARPDIDAVIIATPDHWHSRITIDALKAGKDVYCQKPMVHTIEEGAGIIAAEKASGRILQVGSQYVSSATFQRARQLLQERTIGELNMVEAWLDRNSAIGAWQYTIPPDASTTTCDWERFQGNAPRHAFDAKRFFRWRNYQDYGTGVAGDLFVHLLSGLHFATNSLGPTRVATVGGLRFWNDGRDVPDVMLTTIDYPKSEQHPEFTMFLRVNFKSGIAGESFGVKFIGSQGTMTAGYNSLTIIHQPRETDPGLTISTFPEAMQKQILADYEKQYGTTPHRRAELPPKREENFVPPKGFNAQTEHHRAFQNAVQNRSKSVEDATFGLRAAGPALLANKSLFERKICHWDPVAMREV